MPLNILPLAAKYLTGPLAAKYAKLGAIGVAGAAVAAIPRALSFVRDTTALSATQAAAKNTIVSRVLIEEDIAPLDITGNLIRTLQSMYASTILTVLQRSSEISAGRTVGDALNKVATRGMESYQDTVENLAALTSSVEALTVSTNPAGTAPLAYNINASSEGGVIAPPEMLPVGQVLKFTLTARDENGALEKIDTYLTIRMTPYIVATKAMTEIVTHGYRPGFKLRWLQWKAGEISFLNDLVFEADRIKRMEAAVLADKTGAYTDFVKDLTARDRSRWLDILSNLKSPRMLSNNLANTVLIVNEDTVRRAVVENNFNLEKLSDRQRFFKETYVMMLAVVDVNYHHVTIYLNGYDLPAQFSFSDFSSKKKMDGNDILQVLTAVTSGTRR